MSQLFAAAALVLATLSETDANQMLPTPVDGCDSSPVIMIVSGHAIDRARMQSYNQALQDSGLYAKFGGYYLNAARPIAVLEGDAQSPDVALMVRFPCLANVQAFWNSPSYQNTILPLRSNPDAGAFRVAVYREIDAPLYMAGKVVPAHYLLPYADPSLASVNAEIGTRVPLPYVRRTTLVVSSLDRALTLYRDVLGLSLGAISILNKTSSASQVFGLGRTKPTRFMALSAGPFQPDIVGLIEAGRATRHKRQSTALVVRTFGRRAEILNSLNTLGLRPHATRSLSSTIFGDGTELAFRDWDGNLIVVTDFSTR